VLIHLPALKTLAAFVAAGEQIDYCPTWTTPQLFEPPIQSRQGTLAALFVAGRLTKRRRTVAHTVAPSLCARRPGIAATDCSRRVPSRLLRQRNQWPRQRQQPADHHVPSTTSVARRVNVESKKEIVTNIKSAS